MTAKLQIITNCSNRKLYPVPDELRLRNVAKDGSLKKCANNWLRRLSDHTSETHEAVNLYGGDHWAVARDLPRLAEKRGFSTGLWVASAGYGLIRSDTPIRSYSATFAPGHPDSVVQSSNRILKQRSLALWWKLLASARAPTSKSPTSIAALAESDPASCFLVVASPHYVLAMEDDLLAALSRVRHPERFVIVTSARSFLNSKLQIHAVHSSARFQNVLGGSRHSLHIRTARKMISECDRWALNAEGLRARYGRLLLRCVEPRQQDRRRLTDREVLRFIRSRVSGTDVSWTKLLRQLRQDGCACEQKRFRTLYFQLTGKSHGER